MNAVFASAPLNNTRYFDRKSIFISLVIHAFLFCAGTALCAETFDGNAPRAMVEDLNKCILNGDSQCFIGYISQKMPAYLDVDSKTRDQFENHIRNTFLVKPLIVDDVASRSFGASVYTNISYVFFQTNSENRYLFVKYIFFRNASGWDLVKVDFKRTGDFPLPEW